jgi:glycerophosphoryl diester phosphodiesterase
MFALWFLLAIYSGLYVIFFCFPWLIHKPKDFKVCKRIIRSQKVASIAHRGGLLENYENSMKAFKHSAQLEISGLELDVHKTKDNLMAVIHDSDLSRLTGQLETVDSLNYNEIGEYSEKIYPEYTREFFKKLNAEKERPPLLEEVFEFLKDHPEIFLNIDVKSNKDQDLIDVCRIIKKHGYQDRVIIGCLLNSDTKRIVSEEGLCAPLYFNFNQIIKFVLSACTGMLPFVTFDYDVLEVYGPFETVMDNDEIQNNWKERAYYNSLKIFKPIVPLINWHLNRRGIPIFYWTLNTESDFEYAVQLGCNGIMTDRVSRLKNFLVEKKLF